jgi:hypothetical protein
MRIKKRLMTLNLGERRPADRSTPVADSRPKFLVHATLVGRARHRQHAFRPTTCRDSAIRFSAQTLRPANQVRSIGPSGRRTTRDAQAAFDQPRCFPCPSPLANSRESGRHPLRSERAADRRADRRADRHLHDRAFIGNPYGNHGISGSQRAARERIERPADRRPPRSGSQRCAREHSGRRGGDEHCSSRNPSHDLNLPLSFESTSSPVSRGRSRRIHPPPAQVTVEPQPTIRKVRCIKLSDRVHPSGPAQTIPKGRIHDQPSQSLSQGRRVARWDANRRAAILEDFRRPARAAHHRRAATSH